MASVWLRSVIDRLPSLSSMDLQASSSPDELVHLNLWNLSPGDIEFDRTKNAEHVLTFLHQGCPPTVLGTIYPAPSPYYLHAIKIGIENPAAFLNDTNMIAMSKWGLDRIVEASLAQDGTINGGQMKSNMYKAEYDRRIQALHEVQSKVVDDYKILGERLKAWRMTDSHNIRLRKSAIQRRKESRIEFIIAEIEKIKAERRESLKAPGLAWLLDLTEEGNLAEPEQRKRSYKGKKGLPVQKVGALAFEPQDVSALQAGYAAEALKAMSRADFRLRAASPQTMNAAETLLHVSGFENQPQATAALSTPAPSSADAEHELIDAVPEDVSEVETIIVVSCCERKRNRYAPELIPEYEDDYTQPAALSDASGSVYADDSHNSDEDEDIELNDPIPSKRHSRGIITMLNRVATRNESIPTPPVSSPIPALSQPVIIYRNEITTAKSANAPPRRRRSISPVFHPTKTISQSTINTLEADYPFLSSITPLSVRYDYYHFLSCFGNTSVPSTFFISAPTFTLSQPPAIPTIVDASAPLIQNDNNLMQLQPPEPSKTLKTELNAWFSRNGYGGIKRADKFLKCLWDACAEIVPIEASEEIYGEKRVTWKD